MLCYNHNCLKTFVVSSKSDNFLRSYNDFFKSFILFSHLQHSLSGFLIRFRCSRNNVTGLPGPKKFEATIGHKLFHKRPSPQKWKGRNNLFQKRTQVFNNENIITNRGQQWSKGQIILFLASSLKKAKMATMEWKRLSVHFHADKTFASSDLKKTVKKSHSVSKVIKILRLKIQVTFKL